MESEEAEETQLVLYEQFQIGMDTVKTHLQEIQRWGEFIDLNRLDEMREIIHSIADHTEEMGQPSISCLSRVICSVLFCMSDGNAFISKDSVEVLAEAIRRLDTLLLEAASPLNQNVCDVMVPLGNLLAHASEDVFSKNPNGILTLEGEGTTIYLSLSHEALIDKIESGFFVYLVAMDCPHNNAFMTSIDLLKRYGVCLSSAYDIDQKKALILLCSSLSQYAFDTHPMFLHGKVIHLSTSDLYSMVSHHGFRRKLCETPLKLFLSSSLEELNGVEREE